MADWTVNAEYSRSGNGTNVCPTYWVSELQDALPVYDTWRQFTDETVGGDRLVRAGIGDTIKVNYFDNINVPTASLVEGTFIARGTQASTQVNYACLPFMRMMGENSSNSGKAYRAA